MKEEHITVFGNRPYPPFYWVNALNYFLNGLTKEWKGAINDPRIKFGDVSLLLDAGAGLFRIYGTSNSGAPKPSFSKEETLDVELERAKAEAALRLFINNRALKMIRFKLPKGSFFLWRNPDGECEWGAIDLPETLEAICS